MHSIADKGKNESGDFSKRAELLKRLPGNSVCAEIGVWKGDFSLEILNFTRPCALHLIDPWSFVPALPGRWYGGAQAKSQNDMDAIHAGVVAKLGGNPEVRIHRMRSLDAANIFADHSLDWVYIDGDHSYEAVLADLRSWRLKVRRRGYLAGDDYGWRDENGVRSVERAVNEFAVQEGLDVQLLPRGQFLMEV